MGKLDNKVVIVTGAARGIGKAIAQLFAVEGAKVVCAARTVKEGSHKYLEGSITTTVSEIRAAGGTALAVQTDVSSEESCANLVAKTRETFGPVDVLVNNAVMAHMVPIKDFRINTWLRCFAVSLHGPFMLSQMVLPDMIERRAGAIVNISSGAAIGPGRGPYAPRNWAWDRGPDKEPLQRSSTMYGTAKAAIERFTQGLAEEVYQYGISVAALSPSESVPTPETIYFKVAIPGKPGTEPVEMMARAALLLASEPMDKVTGRVTYSQAILKEFGWITEGKGTGIDQPGSGFSQI